MKSFENDTQLVYKRNYVFSHLFYVYLSEVKGIKWSNVL
jgi:hypothetical protein